MPEQIERVVLDVDEQPAVTATARANSSLDRLEKKAKLLGQGLSDAFSGLSTAAVKTVELAGALFLVKKSFDGIRTAIGGHAENLRRSTSATEGLVTGYRALRFALSPTMFTAASIGVGILAEASIRLAVARAKVIETEALFAAKTGLSIQQLDELSFASRRAGKDSDFFARAVESLSSRIASGEASDAMGKLGVQVDHTLSLAGESTEAFLRIAAALDSIKDPVERARIAIGIFGTDAERILPELGEGISANVERFREFGLEVTGPTTAALAQLKRDLGDARQGFAAMGATAQAAVEGIAARMAAAAANTNQLVRNIQGANRERELDPLGIGSRETRDERDARNRRESRQSAQRELDRVKAASRLRDFGVAESAAPSRAIEEANKRLNRSEGRLADEIKSLAFLQSRRDKLATALASSGQLSDAQRASTAEAFVIADKQLLTGQQRLRQIELLASLAKLSLASQRQSLDALKETEVRAISQDPTRSELERGRAALDQQRRNRIEERSLFIDQETWEEGHFQLSRETLLNIEREFALKRIELERGIAQKKLELVLDKGEAALRFSDEVERIASDHRQKMLEESEDVGKAVIRRRSEFEITQLDFERDARLRQVEAINAQTIEQKIAVENAKAAIESEFLERSFEKEKLLLERATELKIQEMQRGIVDQIALDAIRLNMAADLEQRIAELRATVGAKSTAVVETAGIRSAQVVQDANRSVFETLKRDAEGVFDALLTSGRSRWEALGNAFKTPLLAAIKEIVSAWTASALFRLFTGEKVGISRGQPVFGAGGGGSGILGALLGGGGNLFGGGGGISRPGAPGGTGGFSGPVTSIPGLIGIGLQGGALVGPGGQILGGGGAVGAAAGGGAAFGGSALGLGLLGGAALGGFGAFRLGQSGSRARFAAPAVGAAAGLAGFAGLVAAFPGIFGALAISGPVGWAVAAGVGATIGIISLLVKSAEQKVIDKAKAIYGITLSRQFAKDPIMGIIKQGFGGNIDVGLRSPQVRDLIELYAMSTGQNAGGINARAQSLTLSQSGGRLSALPNFSNGIPSLGGGLNLGGQQLAGPQPVTISLNAEATTLFLQGQAVQAIRANPTEISTANVRASRASSNRRQIAALQLEPMTLVG